MKLIKFKTLLDFTLDRSHLEGTLSNNWIFMWNAELPSETWILYYLLLSIMSTDYPPRRPGSCVAITQPKPLPLWEWVLCRTWILNIEPSSVGFYVFNYWNIFITGMCRILLYYHTVSEWRLLASLFVLGLCTGCTYQPLYCSRYLINA